MRTVLVRLVRRPWLLVLAAVALLAPAVMAIPASGAAAGCSVDYAVDQWTGGYTARIHLTNLGPAVSGWTLAWTYGCDQHVTSAWNDTVTQTGSAVTAVDAGYNGSLATGGSADFGLRTAGRPSRGRRGPVPRTGRGGPGTCRGRCTRGRGASP